MELRKLPYDLSVCKLESTGSIDLDSGFFFVGRTDDEVSLVCRTEEVPGATLEREDGWKGFVISGVLDFSLIGILAGISAVLAGSGIGIFVVSTYNTDYILVKAEDFGRAADALAAAGYDVAGLTLSEDPQRRNAARRREVRMAILSTEYETPIIGALTLASDGEGIVGCWFNNDRYFGYGVVGPMERRDDLPVFDLARAWLDRYFAGEAPDPRELPLAARATPFQLRVREAMLAIPYGKTTTYGAIAQRIEEETGKRASARAVGGAVGRNQLCLIVPCHRVVGADGSLTGFGGGIDMKIALLEHEGVDTSRFRRPTHGTAIDPADWS